ncbi:ALTO [Mastomys natalensis polyomavirus 3]|nr:ALTO [Mastomys natalensis polyomavirus 3]QFU78311.1 ALTO [Mastomys natalensis polyomavirus 3]
MTTGPSATEANTSERNGMNSSENGTLSISRRLMRQLSLDNPIYTATRRYSLPLAPQSRPLERGGETLQLQRWMSPYPPLPPRPPRILLSQEMKEFNEGQEEEEEEEYMEMASLTEGLYLEVLPDAPVPQPPPMDPFPNLLSPRIPQWHLILQDLQRDQMDPILQRSQARRQETLRDVHKALSTQHRLKRLGKTLLLLTFLVALIAICLMLYTVIRRFLLS